MRFTLPPTAPAWMFEAFRQIEQLFTAQPAPFQIKSYTVAQLPSAADWPNSLVLVSDETGGAVLAFSDGADWRRVTDRAVVS